MKFINNLYTLTEIAIHNNEDENRLKKLTSYMTLQKVEKIHENFGYLSKFIPYCSWYIVNKKNVLAMPAHIYDTYVSTGLLPDIENYDIDPDIDKLEYWQYINPTVFLVNPNNGFEFANEMFEDCDTSDIWNLFLSGSARMNYYEGKEVNLEQRIKYAIVEYMLRRKQFYTTEDFVENEILIKKYRKEENK